MIHLINRRYWSTAGYMQAQTRGRVVTDAHSKNLIVYRYYWSGAGEAPNYSRGHKVTPYKAYKFANGYKQNRQPKKILRK